MIAMGALVAVVLHHAEAVDAELVDWLRHQLDAVLGVDALAIVIVLALVIVAVPLTIGCLALRHRRRARHRASD